MLFRNIRRSVDMTRSLRIEYEGAVYHVTARGNERKRIFFTARDYDKFREYVGAARKRFRFIVHCYVLMSNHFHMLIETPEKNLQRIMHYINSSYSIYTNTKRRRCGHLFQGRYKTIVIDKDSYLTELSRYMHLNPVRAKMVEKPEDYLYSSYRTYITGAEDPIVDRSHILRTFGEEISRAERAYKSFVDSALAEELESPLKNVYGGGILGDEDFVNEVLANLEGYELANEEIAHRKELSGNLQAEAILCKVAEHLGEPLQEVLRKGSTRKICVYMLKEYSTLTNREISEIVGQATASSAAKTHQRFLKELEGDVKLKRQIELIEGGMSHVQV
jgi:putative transposase